MHLLRSRTPRLALLTATILLTACASSPPPTAAKISAPADAPPAPPSPAYAATATPHDDAGGIPTSVEGELAALAGAEGTLDGVLMLRGDRDRTVGKKDGDRAPRAEALSNGTAEGCTVACKALASMRRSAEHLCVLAGDRDERCTFARKRVQGASDRVRASCPSCASSAQ